VAAGLRLRRNLRESARVLSSAALVVERSGAIAHADAEVAADPDLRAKLRECARMVDAARGQLATDAPEQAVELWRGLFEGRWSVLEVYDTDGRAYVVACENEPHAAETRALTRRENQVLQLAARGQADALIAYSLGISESTVQTHLARGLAKSGITTRARLLRIAATLGRGREPS
jgi:DNA-binding CsgD family transcriptional regulator